jgi:hypothetical protein
MNAATILAIDSTLLDVLKHPDQAQVCSYRWLPTITVEPGMTIARPISGMSGVRETMYVAIGSTITANTIAQMIAKGVECVAVFDPLPPDSSDYEHSAASFKARLQTIFGPAPNAGCQALMDALMLAQPTLC